MNAIFVKHILDPCTKPVKVLGVAPLIVRAHAPWVCDEHIFGGAICVRWSCFSLRHVYFDGASVKECEALLNPRR